MANITNLEWNHDLINDKDNVMGVTEARFKELHEGLQKAVEGMPGDGGTAFEIIDTCVKTGFVKTAAEVVVLSSILKDLHDRQERRQMLDKMVPDFLKGLMSAMADVKRKVKKSAQSVEVPDSENVN